MPLAYPSPAGINPGNLVKILGFDHGYYEVEQGARTFSVFMTNVIGPLRVLGKQQAQASHLRLIVATER
jgi:hypothetical protein